ncbi:hypothetical protein BKA63DRAFT_561824 [Paraphoma chrysanthemicola]|nr:hypothetical protein BKA63DRAFT_561824 [Paraphoma chrysanthemicola]
MITTTKANLGPWKDESSGEHLISLKSPWGIVVVAVLGIWLSWNTKYIKKIVGNAALWSRIKTLEKKRSGHTTGGPAELTPLLTSRDNPTDSTSNKAADPLAKLLKEKAGIRDLAVDCLFGQDLTNSEKRWLALFTIIVALLATGVIAGGFFAAKVRVDGPAILASDRCGLWLYDSDKRSEAATRARMLDLEKEERAAQFAQDCYGEANAVASRCKVLYQPTLSVSDPVYSNNCPFYKDICRLNQTVTFTTPLIDAKELGFNTPRSPKFRRSTACTPLSMEYPFIQNQTVNGTTTYTYHYGTKRTGNDGLHTNNHTYTTSGDPWERDAPVYDLFAYSYSNGSDNPVWTPHEYLMHGKYSSITIIFVSSLRIYYEEYSTDPIFPADKMVALPGDTRSWFRNSDPRAQPLACMDTIEVCTHDGKVCWDINTPDKEKTVSNDATEFYLLYAALFKTETYYSFAKRQGRSLIAQKKVSQYFSLALGANAWVDEVENWVRTSLARTSINAWSVASGEDSVHEGEDGWFEATKPYGNLCGYYKYNPQGYQTLRMWPLLLAVVSLPALWILSWHWLTAERRTKTSWRWLNAKILGLHTQQNNSRGHRPNTTRVRSSSDATPSRDSEHAPDEAAGQAEAGPSSSQTPATPATEQEQLQTTGSRPVSSLSDQDTTEWEPLVLHKLLYCLWFLISRSLLYVIWVPIVYIRDKLAT